MEICSSCNMQVVRNYVDFKCPKCNKSRFIRCESCRELVKPYTCEECGFEGP